MSARLALLAFLLAFLGAACAAAPTEPDASPDWTAVRAELARRVAVDQDVRGKIDFSGNIELALIEQLAAVDHENTAWMKELVAQHGWPTVARVGAEGSNGAWLLVQHADHDVDFQEQCLALLRAATEHGDADKKNLAYLEDRVAMHRQRPQRYGTQLVQKDGELVPYELEDAARVDAWRAEAGLGTMAEYLELVKNL